MMVFVALLILFFTVWRLVVSLVNYFSQPFVTASDNIVSDETLSLLIPVRNEASHLPALLENLAIQRGIS